MPVWPLCREKSGTFCCAGDICDPQRYMPYNVPSVCWCWMGRHYASSHSPDLYGGFLVHGISLQPTPASRHTILIFLRLKQLLFTLLVSHTYSPGITLRLSAFSSLDDIVFVTSLPLMLCVCVQVFHGIQDSGWGVVLTTAGWYPCWKIFSQGKGPELRVCWGW